MRVKVEGRNKTHTVFLYTLSTCGWCRKTKEYLKQNDVAHEYVDVDKATKEEQKTIVQELKDKKVPVAFPVIIIDEDTIITGYKQQAIKEALGI